MNKDVKELGAAPTVLDVVAAGDLDGIPGSADYARRLDDFIALAAGEPQRIGELLRTSERISADQLEAGLAEQLRTGGMLGDVLVGMGLITQSERDVALVFQKRQAVAAPAEGKFRLGNILLTTGQITREQLDAALAQQKAHGGLLGNALIAAGHVTHKQVTHAILSQRSLVAMALIAAIALALPLAPIVSLAEAGQASANLQVSAMVVANARMRTDYQAGQLAITENDIARGHIDVPAASRFSVTTNSRTGYVIELHPLGDIFQAVQIQGLHGLAHTAQLGADGGTIIQRGPIAADTPQQLSYRFILSPGLQPGLYPWPLMLSVRAL